MLNTWGKVGCSTQNKVQEVASLLFRAQGNFAAITDTGAPVLSILEGDTLNRDSNDISRGKTSS